MWVDSARQLCDQQVCTLCGWVVRGSCVTSRCARICMDGRLVDIYD